MKGKILSVVFTIIIMVLIIFTYIYITLPQKVNTTISEDVICTEDSCSDSQLYYGNDVGNVIENYKLNTFDNQSVELYDLISGYSKVIISLEADWCEDCHRQDEKMIQDNAIPSDVLFIPIYTNYSKEGDDQKQATFESSYKYVEQTYGQTNIVAYYDIDDVLWTDFEAKGTPTNIVLNSEGKILAKTLEVDADILMLENDTDIIYTKK